MKDPKNIPWQNLLPKHLPDEKNWERILETRSMQKQISLLKEKLPMHQPKEGLWLGIQKELVRKKRFVAFVRISAAALLIFGIWGIGWLSNRKTSNWEDFLVTQLSSDQTIAPMPLTRQLVSPDPRQSLTQQNDVKPVPVPDKTPKALELHLEIEIPNISFDSIKLEEPKTVVPENRKEPLFGSKKTVIVQWDEPIRKVKIEGFEIELSEKELSAIQEFENRKKGKLSIQVNSITARLYEKY
ncbi:MAG: hypothetical protein JJU34_08505 [Lunatimonas sp.]|uniref:hypothetical protein n=1 Tax=Lunatimonas sp. TaxID=2060141 RepID=UPI00263B90D5|nr:hypothetical protein [Lunatimonas sp.]MCC5937308.1 hypothetical protein [Lunatimonas sp.]